MIDDERLTYAVVHNDEQQYSMWPVDRSLPDGWYDTGITGSRTACAEYISHVWHDIRPASVRRRLDEHRPVHPLRR